MRVEIAGVLGSGKTTLANVLAQQNIIFEDVNHNIFLQSFYKNPAKYSFETEFSFLFQHYHQIKKSDSSFMVCDFSLIQDLAYAKMGISKVGLSTKF